MSAFRGNDSLKQETLRQLSRHLKAGELLPQARSWDGSKGGPAGCAVHDADLAVYERELGIPAPLAAMMEVVYQLSLPALRELQTKAPGWVSADDAAAGESFPVKWVEAICPGSDLRPVSRQFTSWMLADSEHGAIAHTHDQRVREMLQAVNTAHLGSLLDTPEKHVDWANLRGRAMGLRDGWPERTDSVDAWAASMAETACWPLISDGLAVAQEMVMVYLYYAELRGASIVGWTAEDEARDRELVAEIQRHLDQALPRETRRGMNDEALSAARSAALAPYQERLNEREKRQVPLMLERTKQRWLLAFTCGKTLLRLVSAARK